MRTIRLRIALRDVSPAVVRVIDVPATATLAELHDLFQVALGWTDSHLHQFIVGDRTFGVPDAEWDDELTEDESGVRLRTLPTRFGYLYDFGDHWEHDVEVLGPGGQRPGCVDGEGGCPPEDCDGSPGYEDDQVHQLLGPRWAVNGRPMTSADVARAIGGLNSELQALRPRRRRLGGVARRPVGIDRVGARERPGGRVVGNPIAVPGVLTPMRRREWVAELRGAVYRKDGATVVALAREPNRPREILQLLGDGLAVALGQRVDDAPDAAADCAGALRERGWIGDVELAEQLDGLLGVGPTPMLRPLAVDLEQLSEILEGDPVYTGGAVDRHTGEVWPRSAIEYAGESGEVDEPDFEDEERFLWVHGEGSSDGYRDMRAFIDTITDDDRAARLGIAIQGRGAFGRFRRVLDRWPDESQRWFEFSRERQTGRARAWLADNGYRVASG